MRRLQLTKSVLKFLGELDAKQFRQIVLRVFQLLENPLPHDSETLKGYEASYRVDQGEFRIIYEFDDEIVHIILIGRRNDDDVYRRLKRRN